MQYKYLKIKYLEKDIWTYREKVSGKYTELHNEEADLYIDTLVLLTEAKSRRLRCVRHKVRMGKRNLLQSCCSENQHGNVIIML